jgi:hypothetical protein
MWCKVFHECTLIYGCSSRAATRSWGTSSSQQSDWRTDKPKYGHVPIYGALGKSTAICRNPAGRHQCSSRWIMLLQCHKNASLAVSDGNPYCMLILSGPSCHTEKGFFWLRRGGSRQWDSFSGNTWFCSLGLGDLSLVWNQGSHFTILRHSHCTSLQWVPWACNLPVWVRFDKYRALCKYCLQVILWQGCVGCRCREVSLWSWKHVRRISNFFASTSHGSIILSSFPCQLFVLGLEACTGRSVLCTEFLALEAGKLVGCFSYCNQAFQFWLGGQFPRTVVSKAIYLPHVQMYHMITRRTGPHLSF